VLYCGIYSCKFGSMCIGMPYSVISKVVCHITQKDPCHFIIACEQL
jgi:hypothetical protein